MRRQEELGLREVFASEEQLFAHLWKRGLGVGTAVKTFNRKGCEEKLAKDAKAMNLVWKVFSYASYVGSSERNTILRRRCRLSSLLALR
jgi:hypothetical protein